jgi:hypothetical protein
VEEEKLEKIEETALGLKIEETALGALGLGRCAVAVAVAMPVTQI